MDAVSRAVETFQAAFREWRARPEATVLRILTDPVSMDPLPQILRGEEWRADNGSPFLIFRDAFDSGGECFHRMAAHVRDHYEVLRTGMEKEGRELEEFGAVRRGTTPLGDLARHIVRWLECTGEVLEPPIVCWIVPSVQGPSEFVSSIKSFVTHAAGLGVRFVVSDSLDQPTLGDELQGTGLPLEDVEFRIDQEEMARSFREQWNATPRKGRMPGTPLNAAAPDVEPPPRPGPSVTPSEAEVRGILEEQGLPPALTMAGAERLQRLVFEAAEGAGRGDADVALGRQYEAYKLCQEAGVKLEASMMALVLAGHLLRFQRDEEAVQWFGEASRLAREGEAPAQVSQAEIGRGQVLFKGGRYREAGEAYLVGAAAAEEAESSLLILENLRMAAHCVYRDGRTGEAVDLWMKALERARDVPPAELDASSFPAMVDEMKVALEEPGFQKHREFVEEVERELANRASA